MAPKVVSSKTAAKSPKTSATLPKNWPTNLTYLRRPLYSKTLSPATLTALTTPPSPPPPAITPSPPYLHIRISAITSPTHPAHRQHGLFATATLPPSSLILPYLGLVHSAADEDPASDYDLSLDRELGVGVDATRAGNEARFINDYRGVGPAGPNAEFGECWMDVGGGRCEKVMGVFVLGAGKKGKRKGGVAKGEEVLVSYGKGFWGERKGGDEDGPAQAGEVGV